MTMIDKNVVVTGASSGVGLAASILLAEQAARIGFVEVGDFRRAIELSVTTRIWNGTFILQVARSGPGVSQVFVP
jgi:NAD(P)-dependent dehydrogenase (short-subunit alcohol dehydrogenase family)